MKSHSITHQQLQLLLLLFKYRFASQALIAVGLNTTNNKVLYVRLKLLCDMRLVGKRYEPADRLQGKPIVYYLTPEGMRQIRGKHRAIDEALIKSTYRDKGVSEQFIEHNLNTFAVSLKLQKLHRELEFYSKRQLTKVASLPDPKPDGLIIIPNPSSPNPHLLFLDIIPSQHQRLELRRRLNNYIDFFEYEDWDTTKNAMPRLLIVCSRASLEEAAIRQTRTMLYDAYIENLDCFTTTLERVHSATTEHTNIWADIARDNKRRRLYHLPNNENVDP